MRNFVAAGPSMACGLQSDRGWALRVLRWSTFAVAAACMLGPAVGRAAGLKALGIQAPARATHTEPSSVSCPTDQECLAVGSWLNRSYVRSGLVERWSGERWRIVASGAQKGRAGHPVFLRAVSCPAAESCVVVGERADDSTNPPSSSTSLSERWDGSRWQSLSVARVAGAMLQLGALSCTSPTNCVAVGSVGTMPDARAVAERYRGHRWRVSYLAPAGGGPSSLNDVSCAGVMCLAVGYQHQTRAGWRASVLLWRGGHWTSVPFSGPNRPSLDVSCSDATDCLITGASLGSHSKAILESFNGQSLSAIPVPSIDALGAVSCASRSFCLVLGAIGAATGSSGVSIAEVFNGTALSPAFSDHAGPLTCRPSFCMLLGSSQGQPHAYQYLPAAS
jgi:hypothetical protein